MDLGDCYLTIFAGFLVMMNFRVGGQEFLGIYVFPAGLKSFKDHKVVPDIIPVAPPEIVKVTYPNGIEIHEGNVLTLDDVKDTPKLEWPADSNKQYTMCLLDIDSPTPADPRSRSWQHWLVGNIQGNDLATGELLTGFVGSGAAPGSGLHRYVFLVYQQPGKITFNETFIANTDPIRGYFVITNFAEMYNLGYPVAGNFYQAERDAVADPKVC